MNWTDLIGPALVAALVTGLVTIWRERATERRRRDEQVRDIQSALSAEIRHYTDLLELFDLQEALETTLRRMRTDPDYRPRVPSEKNDSVFQAMIGDIHRLPESVIDPVVRYYSQLIAITALIDDLRSDVFRNADAAQRELMFTDFISLKAEALRLGRAAQAVLNKALSDDLAAEAAQLNKENRDRDVAVQAWLTRERARGSVNRRDAGQSGQR